MAFNDTVSLGDAWSPDVKPSHDTQQSFNAKWSHDKNQTADT